MDGTSPRFDFTAAPPPIDDLGAVHLIAIGGSGMSALARVLLARGLVVSGSDATDSATISALRAEGARVWVGHDPRHVDDADTVIISGAIREDNVELARARERQLRVLHRAQGLAAAMAGQRRLAVAGANGKTTTTSMLTVALDAAGLRPSFASGGELADRGTNAAWHPGTPFVVEADESDGSFLAYRPDVAVVTNVQPDHLDFYGTFDRVEEAYARFARSGPRDGLVIACADDPGSAALARAVRAERRVLTYGVDESADLRITRCRLRGTGSSSLLRDPRGVEHRLELSIPGGHNVLNAAAAFLAAVEGALAAPDRVLHGLATFAGARRRFEIRGEVDGVLVVDDYAHNPGKVTAVVATAARLAADRGGRLWTIFQPHLYSRTRDFAAGFAAALAPSDEVILLPIYGAREAPMAGVTAQLIAEPLRAIRGRPVRVLDPAEVVAVVRAQAGAGDIVLTVGAGDVTTLGPRIVEALGRR